MEGRSRFLRIAILEALLNHYGSSASVTVNMLAEEIFSSENSIAEKYSLNSDKSIEKTIERTLKDFMKIKQGVLNLRVDRVRVGRQVRYYVVPIGGARS